MKPTSFRRCARPALLGVMMLAIITMIAAQPAAAQDREAEVRAAIDQLFDGMRAGDSTMVRATIHPDARFMTTFVRDGKPVLHTGSVDQFVAAVGTPHDQVWDERISDVEIRVDDRLAQAWMNYAFYLGDEFSHCGVNAFQLFDDGTSWRIIQVTDTRRQDGCEMPD